VSGTRTISHRGATFEVGRGPGFYGVWSAGSSESQPLQWWPETPEGWYDAWSRFVAIEMPGSINPVSDVSPVDATKRRAFYASGLLAIGVALGVVGIFTPYLNGTNLASQPAEVVPHAIYLAVWAASAVLIWSGGARRQVGALFGFGLSIVAFGFFLTDGGTVIAAGTHIMGAGFVLGIIGWCACTVGASLSLGRWAIASQTLPRGYKVRIRLMMVVGALGAAISFAPAWDRFTLHTAAGAAQSLSVGNAFSNPAPVIAGNLAVMITFAGIVAVIAAWRPVLMGSALFIGALIPMVAQGISALVQFSETTSPTLFGISNAQASRAGLTINAGLTPTFWIYCVFVVALIVLWARMLVRPNVAAPDAAAFSISSDLAPT
jgi:hypothetical protein